MTRYRIYQVDAFTTEKFAGNPAGVVPDADGLTDRQMQAIAQELNNSETAFVFKPQQAGHDVWVRFFTPTTEVPSCGHAPKPTTWQRISLCISRFGQRMQLRGCCMDQKAPSGHVTNRVPRARDTKVTSP